MGRPSLSWSEYQQIGEKKGLALAESNTPVNVHARVRWTCKNCGVEHIKSTRSVQSSDTGCNCQNPLSLPEESYHSLASELGISWVGDLKPVNTKTPTKWVRSDGTVFTATYRDLKYRRTDSMLLRLGLTDAE